MTSLAFCCSHTDLGAGMNEEAIENIALASIDAMT